MPGLRRSAPTPARSTVISLRGREAHPPATRARRRGERAISAREARRIEGSRMMQITRRLMVVAWVMVVVGVGTIGASQRPAHASDCDPAKQGCCALASTIAFSSTRDNPGANPPFLGAEIYLLNPDGSDPRRLTDNTAGDGFPNLSPDGKTIVFDSSRLTGLQNVSDLFQMEADGSDQTLLTRGSSATWSPDGEEIAFHASASYYASGGLVTGSPIRMDPGSATTDSDIFVATSTTCSPAPRSPRTSRTPRTRSRTTSTGQGCRRRRRRSKAS